MITIVSVNYFLVYQSSHVIIQALSRCIYFNGLMHLENNIHRGSWALFYQLSILYNCKAHLIIIATLFGTTLSLFLDLLLLFSLFLPSFGLSKFMPTTCMAEIKHL